MTVGPLTEEQEPVLLWVHTGTATFEAAGSTHHLTAGEALWVPPGVEHCTRTDEGAVVFPLLLWPAESSGALAEAHVVPIPPGWDEWLIHQWDDNSYTRDTLAGAEALLHVVAATSPGGEGVESGMGALPLPRSHAALAVARSLLRNPGSPRDLESFAARERVSRKTLQRQFLHETGMAFSVWRTRARTSAATRRLAEGHDIGWTGRHVGYATPTGFTKAFRRHTGLTPSEFSHRHRVGPPRTTASRDQAKQTIVVAIDPAQAAPRVPPRTCWDLVNPFHELMWVYRGDVQVRIGTRCWPLTQGQAIWVPGGLTHSVEFAADSLMMTVGTAHGRVGVDVDALTVYRFPPEAESFLLHTMLSEFTFFRPATGQGALVKELFNDQFGLARSEPAGVTGVLGDIAGVLRRDPADSRSLADWAARFRTTPEALGKELVTQAGDTFPQWRARIRMDAARDLLKFGEPPGQVFRRLGYSSSATFTRAFTGAHGISPREYQRREARRAGIGG